MTDLFIAARALRKEEKLRTNLSVSTKQKIGVRQRTQQCMTTAVFFVYISFFICKSARVKASTSRFLLKIPKLTRRAPPFSVPSVL